MLTQGEHKTLECSNCWCPLVNVLVTQPNADFDWKLTAECPFCGDRSFCHELHGMYYYDHTEYSTVVDTVVDGRDVLFKTIKGEKEWR